jgi:hypothetical protein
MRYLPLEILHNLEDCMREFHRGKFCIMLVSSLVKKEVIEWKGELKMVMRANWREGLRGRQITRNIGINNPVLFTALVVNKGINEGGAT